LGNNANLKAMDIPSKYQPNSVEAKISNIWIKNKSFLAQVNSAKQPFSILIPPPNVTGILHMGHALNNVIQDVLVRFKRMQGHESLWMPGTDHAGIATQNVVEKKIAKNNKNRNDLGRASFLKEVWQWKEEYGSTIIEQLKRLGSSCDWDRLRFTMDDNYSKAVTRAFILLWNKKLLYRGNYIINWCPRCQTALADEEAPHKEASGKLYYIKYPLHNNNNHSNQFITIATTRPETMFGDTAIAVNPQDTKYSKVIGKQIRIPLTNRIINIIQDNFVDPEFGTGAVKVTPAHDKNDFDLGKRHSLQSILIMNPDGTMNKNAGEFKGLDRFKARSEIIKQLTKKGLVDRIEDHPYTLGYCYRCNTIIEPYLSRQWFVRMKPLAKPAIAAVKQKEINFYPQRWEKVYLNWMENIHDWCISRQIWWGHRLPVYYCQACQQKDPEQGIIVAENNPKKCPVCNSDNIIQDPDVLDTWFSSWLWPFATFGWPFPEQAINNGEEKTKGAEKQKQEFNYFYPTSVLVTAPEIIFFWVARMIMAGFEFIGEKPFSTVYIHGTVRDSSGKKMSKSLGNIIDPIGIIEKFGTDALRFSLMLLAASGSDIYLNEDKFLVGRNFANKIWNASRFIFIKISEQRLQIDNFEWELLNPMDEWILQELNLAIENISMNLEHYVINEAAKKAYDFFWNYFCDWYIEIIKDSFTLDKAKIAVYILINSLKLIHPFMPFISEEIFSEIGEATSVDTKKTLIISDWPKILPIDFNSQEIILAQQLIDTIKEIRNIKTELGLAQKKTILKIVVKEQANKIWQDNLTWIKRLTQSENIVFADKISPALYENNFWSISLDTSSVNMDIFIAGIEKKINSAHSTFNKAKLKLENPNFLKKASPETIKAETQKFNDLSCRINRLTKLKNVFI